MELNLGWRARARCAVCRPCAGTWISFPSFPRAYALGYTLPPLPGAGGTNAFFAQPPRDAMFSRHTGA